jgi:hypothetical protein
VQFQQYGASFLVAEASRFCGGPLTRARAKKLTQTRTRNANAHHRAPATPVLVAPLTVCGVTDTARYYNYLVRPPASRNCYPPSRGLSARCPPSHMLPRLAAAAPKTRPSVPRRIPSHLLCGAVASRRFSSVVPPSRRERISAPCRSHGAVNIEYALRFPCFSSASLQSPPHMKSLLCRRLLLWA